MKIIVTLFWALVIGQVAGYIMFSLAGLPDNPSGVALVSIVFGIFVLIINALFIEKPTKEA